MIGVILSASAATDDSIRDMIAEHRSDGTRVETWVAWESGQAGQLTSALLRGGASRLVVMVGDGTIHEVVNALHDNGALDRVAVAVVPGGTGNDFVRALDRPTEEIGDALLASSTRRVDLIDAGSSVAVNAVTFGAGTEGTRNASPRAKQLAGGLAYFFQALRESSELADTFLELDSAEGHGEGDVWGVAVCNGTSFGGGLCVAPDARIDDGLLDIAVLPSSSSPTLEAITTLLSPEGNQRSSVMHVRADRVTLRFSTDTPTHVDGEFSMVRSACLRVIPGALTLTVDDVPLESSLDASAQAPGPQSRQRGSG